MAKKQPQAPLVTSFSTSFKRSTKSETSVATPEEVKEKKTQMLSAVDAAFEQFKKNLFEGKVEMNSSLDLERLVKLTLLLTGEADSVTGKPIGQEETLTSQNISLSMSKVNEILDLNDPNVKAMYDKLYEGMNEINDIDD